MPRRSTRTMQKYTGKALSDDMLEEILLRLPSSEPLCRFRSVSKSFESLISHHSFGRRFRARHQSLIVGFFTQFEPITRIRAGYQQGWFTPTTEGTPRCIPIRFRHLILVQSGGLLLCHQNNRGGLFLFNPITGGCRLLPELSHSNHWDCYRMVGFHVQPQDEQHGDELFFSVACVCFKGDDRLAISLFSSVTGQWIVSQVVIRCFIAVAPVVLDGVFYWMPNSSCLISSPDNNGISKLILLPSELKEAINQSDPRCIAVKILDGHICFLVGSAILGLKLWSFDMETNLCSLKEGLRLEVMREVNPTSATMWSFLPSVPEDPNALYIQLEDLAYPREIKLGRYDVETGELKVVIRTCIRWSTQFFAFFPYILPNWIHPLETSELCDKLLRVMYDGHRASVAVIPNCF